MNDFELLTMAVLAHTEWPHITWDADDGYDYDVRLPNGNLLMANLYPDGKVDASVYDTNYRPVKTIKRMPHTTANTLIQEVICQ